MGWRVSMDLQALAVYSLGAGRRTGAGADQLGVGRGGPERRRHAGADGLRANQDGVGAADCYLWKTGADLQPSDPGVHDHGGTEPAGQGDGGHAAVRGNRLCLSPAWRTVRGPLRMFCSPGGELQHWCFPHHRRIGKAPGSAPVSRGYQRGRRDRGTPHGSPARRGTRTNRTAGGLDQL